MQETLITNFHIFCLFDGNNFLLTIGLDKHTGVLFDHLMLIHLFLSLEWELLFLFVVVVAALWITQRFVCKVDASDNFDLTILAIEIVQNFSFFTYWQWFVAIWITRRA